jgi:hypothetical protein
MSERTNADRIRDGRNALTVFGQLDGRDIRDLIADLLHVARADGLDPRAEMDSAWSHFEAEVDE